MRIGKCLNLHVQQINQEMRLCNVASFSSVPYPSDFFITYMGLSSVIVTWKMFNI